MPKNDKRWDLIINTTQLHRNEWIRYNRMMDQRINGSPVTFVQYSLPRNIYIPLDRDRLTN